MLPFLFTLLLSANAAAPPSTNGLTPAESTTRNKTEIRVYQTPNQPGSLTVRSSAKAKVQFYLFDLDGNLVYESFLQSHQPLTIQGLSNGTYTYHAFVADTRLKGGQVHLKN